MTGEAILFMILSMVIVWGTLLAAVIFLARKPEVDTWPPGDPDYADTEDLSMD